MDAVRAPDHRRVPMLLRPLYDGGEGTVESLEEQQARLPHLERERRVDNV
jgi:hypothetical protein